MSVKPRHVVQGLHPALTDVLNRLDGSTLGRSFRDRAVEVSTSKIFADPIDRVAALAAHRWLLKRADGEGLPLTASGYLKPADVQALAVVLPTMRDWPFTMTREIDVQPVLHFREHLKRVGLLRKYRGTLRLTKAGRDALADHDALWMHLADALVLTGSNFDVDASIVVLVHMATTEGRIGVEEVATTMTALGWRYPGGAPMLRDDVYPVWNLLWTALGNVGEPVIDRYSDRNLSLPARVIVHDALFTELSDALEPVTPEPRIGRS